MACLSKLYIVNHVITATVFYKNLYHMKSVLWLSPQILFETFSTQDQFSKILS